MSRERRDAPPRGWVAPATIGSGHGTDPDRRLCLERDLVAGREGKDPAAMAAALEGLAQLAEAEGDPEPARIFRREAAHLRGADTLPVHGAVAGGPAGPAPTQASTATLLALTQVGDPRAREHLAGRYVTVLRSFAHGRIPARARDMVDTEDLVQSSIRRGLARVKAFKPRRDGAFLADLRHILMNQVRDEVRRARRRPAHEALTDEIPARSPSPSNHVAEREVLARYESGVLEPVDAMAHGGRRHHEGVRYVRREGPERRTQDARSTGTYW